jgi:ERCC4-type nuclease
MAIVSYKIYCDECERSEVIKKSVMDEHLWVVNSTHQHSGLCPICNPAVNEKTAAFEDDDVTIVFTELRGIGQQTAENLQKAGYETRGDVRDATDEQLGSVSGVGATSIESLRKEV